MPPPPQLLQGEHRRTVDDRFRISIPGELADPLTREGPECILAKEMPGALSVWSAFQWQGGLEKEVHAVSALLQAGRLADRVDVVQSFGRLLSTRHRPVQLTGRGRLLIPEGFREFLGVDPGSSVLIIGAALCVEIWHPDAWLRHLEEQIPQFRRILNQLLAAPSAGPQ